MVKGEGERKRDESVEPHRKSRRGTSERLVDGEVGENGGKRATFRANTPLPPEHCLIALCAGLLAGGKKGKKEKIKREKNDSRSRTGKNECNEKQREKGNNVEEMKVRSRARIRA